MARRGGVTTTNLYERVIAELFFFLAVPPRQIVPHEQMIEVKVPDSTPGLVARYALSDEQALLAKVRYCRLIDVFTGVACYSLQSHLRTHVPGMGQVRRE